MSKTYEVKEQRFEVWGLSVFKEKSNKFAAKFSKKWAF